MTRGTPACHNDFTTREHDSSRRGRAEAQGASIVGKNKKNGRKSSDATARDRRRASRQIDKAEKRLAKAIQRLEEAREEVAASEQRLALRLRQDGRAPVVDGAAGDVAPPPIESVAAPHGGAQQTLAEQMGAFPTADGSTERPLPAHVADEQA